MTSNFHRVRNTTHHEQEQRLKYKDAMKLAVQARDRPVQARCLVAFGDIYRSRADVERAYSRYELAMGMLAEIGDKLGQTLALSGMAKALDLVRRADRVCDCKVLELNNKALELATSLGNKTLMYACHIRMEELYRSLGDGENEQHQGGLARSLGEEMELVCGVCREEYGLTPNKLDTLPCSHIFHSKCVEEVLHDRRRKQRPCPICRKALNSQPYSATMNDDETAETSTNDEPV